MWCMKKKIDSWIACDVCDRWYHYSCVGIDQTPEDDAVFKCPPCNGFKPPLPTLDRMESEVEPLNLMEEDA